MQLQSVKVWAFLLVCFHVLAQEFLKNVPISEIMGLEVHSDPYQSTKQFSKKLITWLKYMLQLKCTFPPVASCVCQHLVLLEVLLPQWVGDSISCDFIYISQIMTETRLSICLLIFPVSVNYVYHFVHFTCFSFSYRF